MQLKIKKIRTYLAQATKYSSSELELCIVNRKIDKFCFGLHLIDGFNEAADCVQYLFEQLHGNWIRFVDLLAICC